MYQRQRTRFSMASEDEYSIKMKQLEKNVQAKKSILKQEFEKLEEERKYDKIRAQTNREFEFKKELDKLIIANNERKVLLKNKEDQLDMIHRVEKDKTSLPMPSSIMFTESTRKLIQSTYKSVPIELISMKEEMNREELNLRLAKLLEDCNQGEENLKVEQEKMGSIKNKIDEILMEKNQIKFKISDLIRLNTLADQKFKNVDNILYTSKEKLKNSNYHLKNVQQDVNELRNIENEFLETKKDKHNKFCETSEFDTEIISRTLYEIDNAKKKYEDTLEELQLLEMQEAELNEKIKEAFVVEQYIWAFKELEKCFIKGKPEEYCNQTYYFSKEQRENLRVNIINVLNGLPEKSFNNGSNIGTPTLRGEEVGSNTSRRSKEDIRVAGKKSDRSRRTFEGVNTSEDRQAEKVKKLEVVSKMDRFYEDFPEGPIKMVQKLIEKYREMAFYRDSMQNLYTDNSLVKKEKTLLLESLNKIIEELKLKNNDLHLVPNEDQTEQPYEFENTEARDGGILRIAPQLRDPKIDFTTVNVVKVLKTDSKLPDKIVEDTEMAQRFFFMSYTHLLNFITRVSNLVLFLSENTPAVTLELDKKCREVLSKMGEVSKFGMNTLGGGSSQNLQSLNLSRIQSHTIARENVGKRAARNTLQVGMAESERLVTENTPVNMIDIKNLFLLAYPERFDFVQKFLNFVKQDEILAFFLSFATLKNYLERIKFRDDNPEETLDIGNIETLKMEIIFIAKERFKFFLTNFADILKAIRENSENILIDIQEKRPNFRLRTNIKTNFNNFIRKTNTKIANQLQSLVIRKDENESDAGVERPLEESVEMHIENPSNTALNKTDYMKDQINKASLLKKTNDPIFKYKKITETENDAETQRKIAYQKMLSNIKTDEDFLDYERKKIKQKENGRRDGRTSEKKQEKPKSVQVVERLYNEKLGNHLLTENVRLFSSNSQVLSKLDKLDKSKKTIENLMGFQDDLRFEKASKLMDLKKEEGKVDQHYLKATRAYDERKREGDEMRSRLSAQSSKLESIYRMKSEVSAFTGSKEQMPKERKIKTSNSANRRRDAPNTFKRPTLEGNARFLINFTNEHLQRSVMTPDNNLGSYPSLMTPGGFYPATTKSYGSERISSMATASTAEAGRNGDVGRFHNFPFFANNDYDNQPVYQVPRRKNPNLLVEPEPN